MKEPPPDPTQRLAAVPTVRATVVGDLPVFQPTERGELPQLPPLADFAVGTVLKDRYRIDAKLGAGGMGVVYRAQDLELNRPIALKFLSMRLMNDQQRALLINEVNCGLDVTHPNVCRIHSLEHIQAAPTTPGGPPAGRIDFLCMEFVEGETLDALLRRAGKLPRDQALQICQDLCAGLAAVHEKGMLHRDLKPSNIMIDQHGTARLTDFGVAAVAKNAGEGIVGTPGYLSVEVLEGKPGTVQSDIYALGLVLCEILTGKPVFQASDVPTQIHEVRHIDLPRTPGLSEIEPAIRAVLLRCLRPNPADRPRTVNQVAAALAEASIRGLLRKQTLALGALLTLAILIAEATGLFAGLERTAYDFRARHPLFAPPPSKQIVHVDIDDASLQEIGHFPWPRTKFTEIIDELNRAGPKVMAMDITFSEPDDHTPQQQLDGSWAIVPGDKIFAASVARGANVLIPVTIPLDVPADTTPLHTRMVELLERDLESSPQQLLDQLSAAGLDDPDLAGQAEREYPFALRQALFGRIDVALGIHPTTQESAPRTIVERLLPRSAASGAKTRADRALEKLLPQVLAARQLERFTLPMKTDDLYSPAPSLMDMPVPQLAEAARYCGFVDNIAAPDGVVRDVPMFIRYRNGVMPQFGLALACAYLGVDVHSIRIDQDRLIIPRPGEAGISIPVRWMKFNARGDSALFMDVPYFGGSDWKTMYDVPAHQASVQHMPIVKVWDLCQVNQEIESNDFLAQSDVEKAYSYIDNDLLNAYHQRQRAGQIPRFDDSPGWSKLMDNVFSQMPFGARDFYLAADSQFQTDRERDTATAVRNLWRRRQLNDNLTQQQTRFRDELRGRLGGKAVIIGAVASSMYDICRTPLQIACPGSVVHGVIFSAIVTGHFWRTAPHWLDLTRIVLLGLLTTAAATWLSPRRAMAAAACLFGVYLIYNDLVLFDIRHVVAELAGPLIVIVVVWSICSVARLLTMLAKAKFAAR